MAQDPQILLSFDDEGDAIVIVDDTEAGDARTLLELAPDLKEPGKALQLAQALNHLAHEQTFAVIEDPAAFADWYKKRLAEEDTDADWVEGTYQLSNYATPDLTAIEAPRISGDTLTFFAINRQLGAIYVVSAGLGGDTLTPDYEPMTN
ncbi:hypothetical protein AB9K34_23670 [Sedimentitalea sp. XS_ASV28]|uniref:hypothetical protein n=1 Tax=Sedimentitalea sp. XS_ASV28 TaxID=3241296 RepID=UPI003513D6FC